MNLYKSELLPIYTLTAAHTDTRADTYSHIVEYRHTRERESRAHSDTLTQTQPHTYPVISAPVKEERQATRR